MVGKIQMLCNVLQSIQSNDEQSSGVVQNSIPLVV